MQYVRESLPGHTELIENLQPATALEGLRSVPIDTRKSDFKWMLADQVLIARIHEALKTIDSTRPLSKNEARAGRQEFATVLDAISENSHVRVEALGTEYDDEQKRFSHLYESVHPEIPFRAVWIRLHRHSKSGLIDDTDHPFPVGAVGAVGLGLLVAGAAAAAVHRKWRRQKTLRRIL